MTSWFGVTCVRYESVAQLLSFSSAIYGRWFDLQLWKSQYTLLMGPNKIETAVQYVMRKCSLDFLGMVIQFLVFREMVHFSNTIYYYATQMNNETSF